MTLLPKTEQDFIAKKSFICIVLTKNSFHLECFKNIFLMLLLFQYCLLDKKNPFTKASNIKPKPEIKAVSAQITQT